MKLGGLVTNFDEEVIRILHEPLPYWVEEPFIVGRKLGQKFGRESHVLDQQRREPGQWLWLSWQSGRFR